MELLLDESQNLLHDAAARLCTVRGGPRRSRALRNTGWPATMVAEEHGGLGLGAFDLALVIEEAGRHLVMTPLVESATAAWALSQAATGQPVPPALAEILDGTRLVIAAAHSPDWRYDGAMAPDGLRLDAGRVALSGTVAGIPFAGIADRLLVDATDSNGVPLVALVSRQSPGLSIVTARNVDGATTNTLSFANVAVAGDAVVARDGAAAALSERLRELLLLLTATELLGLAEGAFAMTNDYLKLRQQFGRPIGSFQALQHRMVNCHVDLELSRSLIYRLLSAWDERTCHPAMVSAAKARISRGALETVRTALQLHGAIGYTDEHDIGLFYKRATALAAKYGNEINHVNRFSALTWDVAEGGA
jgi:alkylation response protein AidB-like acyl-CoA dehydrogenase